MADSPCAKATVWLTLPFRMNAHAMDSSGVLNGPYVTGHCPRRGLHGTNLSPAPLEHPQYRLGVQLLGWPLNFPLGYTPTLQFRPSRVA